MYPNNATALDFHLLIRDQISGKARSLDGIFTLHVVGGGPYLHAILPYTNGQILSFNPIFNKTDSKALVWAPYSNGNPTYLNDEIPILKNDENIKYVFFLLIIILS